MGRSGRAKALAGPKAIETYLEPHEGGRFIQSIKSFAASSTFQQTSINGRSYTIEELIGLFLRMLRTQAERLEQEELVLIADFGGGTSDFSLICAGRQGREAEILGNSGVAGGGDTFDARMIRHLVSPMLGLGSSYRLLGKVLPIRVLCT